MADYFQAMVMAGADAKVAANWITGQIAGHVNSNWFSYSELPFQPDQLAEMVQLIDCGKIAQEISSELLEKGGLPKANAD